MPQRPFNYAAGWGILPNGQYGRITDTIPRTGSTVSWVGSAQGPSSGSWVGTTPSAPSTTRNIGQGMDYGVRDSSGRIMSINTGQPWTGVEPRTGVKYENGLPVEDSRDTVYAPGIGPINPNDPIARFRPFSLPRDPAMEEQRQALIKDFAGTTGNLQGIQDYLKKFEDAMNLSFDLNRQAVDPSEAIAGMRAAQGRYGTDLDQATAAYISGLQDQAGNLRGVVGQAQTDLGGFNAAQDAVKADQLAQLLKGFKGMQLAGTNAPSGYNAMILAREAARAAIPIELAKQERKYDILRSMALPVEQRIGADALAYAGQFLPGIGAARFGADTSTEMNIQALRERVAGLSLDQAIKFMTSAGVPQEVMARVLGLQTQTALGLTDLGARTNVYGVQDVLGTELRQPTPVSMPVPVYGQPGPQQVPTGTPTPQQPQATPGSWNNWGMTGQDQYGRGVEYRGINSPEAYANWANQMNALAGGGAGIASNLFTGPALTASMLAGLANPNNPQYGG